ncbi:MAG: 16S rRNA (guanine(966)-N(2))-methyltransferase RsmD [Planctomycetia bacterium]|nr:16S rRNA (guanine(966)-N(2))-methyltransferase RsmD [Planctomycetia bacterium]
MQILAGRYKGVSIQTSAKYKYRPTQSKVRKSLFDILGDLTDKTVIDLFAGSGILGFEALSRMAKSVIFVETNRNLVQLLYKNCLQIDQRNCIIKRMDAYKFLNEKRSVDLILVDPPYGQKELNLLIELCRKILNPNGMLVLETSTKDEHINADNERIYGSTRLSFWRNK